MTNYIKPEAEVIELSTTDIIMTSGLIPSGVGDFGTDSTIIIGKPNN